MVKVAHHFFITICAASGRGGMEIIMKTSQLLLSVLDITEDHYSFKAQFILSAAGKSKNVDISELDSASTLEKIKTYFDLEESHDDIKKEIMKKVMEKAQISSKINEGDNY